MKDKLLASSPTREGIEKLISEYYYNSKFFISEDLDYENRFKVFNYIGLAISNIYVERKKGRFYFRRID